MKLWALLLTLESLTLCVADGAANSFDGDQQQRHGRRRLVSSARGMPTRRRKYLSVDPNVQAAIDAAKAFHLAAKQSKPPTLEPTIAPSMPTYVSEHYRA
jgi:hypothetical protein